MQISEIVDAIIDLIKINIIAKTNITQDISSGDTTIKVINTFQFKRNQEILLIDYGYNDPNSPHYRKYEYAVIKSVTDTRTLVLKTPVIDNWLVADQAFIQKALGHDALYEENVLFGDRDVIPTDVMAVAVEPVSLSNEWIYLQGGLSEESRINILIYGKSVETEEGMRILSKYTEAIYQLLNDNLHLNINDYQTPIVNNIYIGDTEFCIEDTPENQEEFVVGSSISNQYQIQDNIEPPCVYYCIVNKTTGGGKICLEIDGVFQNNYSVTEFGVVSKLKRYLYDSRIDNVTWGVTQKGSAILRASELSWFGKEVNEHRFPQHDKKVIYFAEQDDDSSSSSSSS